MPRRGLTFVTGGRDSRRNTYKSGINKRVTRLPRQIALVEDGLVQIYELE